MPYRGLNRNALPELYGMVFRFRKPPADPSQEQPCAPMPDATSMP